MPSLLMRLTTLLIASTLLLTACSEKPAVTTDDPQLSPNANTSTVAPAEAVAPIRANKSLIKVLDISERSREGRNGIAVTFNTPLDSRADINSFFVIDKQPQGRVDGSWIIGKDTRKAWFMNVEPNTTYHITVNPGLVAMNKSQLLTGSDALVTLRSLQPSVNFDSDGMVLPLGYASGLPVVSVNIPSIDIDFFRIRDDRIAEFVNFTQRNGRDSWYANRLAKMGELAHSARFDLNPPKNTRVKRDLNIQQFEALRHAGLYLAIMRPAGDYEDKIITWFAITDIGLHLRHYKNQLDVHAASLTTGKPLEGVTLELLDKKNRVLASNTTTQNGLASFNGHFAEASVLVGTAKNQYTLLNLRQPALDLSEFDLGSRPSLPHELFIYGPRDLYRPGETATFSALLRDHDGKLGQTSVLTANIRNPSGSTAKAFKWSPDEQGYYQLSWTIPNSAPTGKWELVVTGLMEKPITYNFNVEEFLPERLKLTMGEHLKRTEVLNKDTNVTLPILGEYLYGAPAAGNKFSSLLQVSKWRDAVESLKGYEFGDIADTNYSAYEELQDITLNTDGKASLNIRSYWNDTRSPLKVNIVGSLFESGGRPVTRAHPLLIWPKSHLMGIRPHFGDTNPEPGTSVKFDIVNANSQGELAIAENVDITLIREDTEYFWEYNEHQGWHWNYTEKEFVVATESISLDDTTAGTVSFPVDWGEYRLEVRNVETNSLSSLRFFAGHNWYYDWENADDSVAARPDKINLALDKNAYSPGDVATLKILPPADGEALILVESDKPLWSKKIAVKAAGSVVEIPIDPSWDTHNLYISALLIQPAGNTLSTTPKRALGLIHLPLDRSERKLDIQIEAPEKVLPETTVTVHVSLPSNTTQGSVNTASHNARVTLAAVDVGVLNISDFETPDPFGYFFSKRRYGIDAKDMYADVIEFNQADPAEYRFGGDADLVRGGNKPKSDVRIISLYNGPVAFDASGKAQVKFDIPDFNGRLRLMALAYSDIGYGSHEKEMTVAAPVIAEIAMPRFLAKGDHSVIALDVQNLTDETQTLTVNTHITLPLAITSPTTAKPQTFTLASKEKTTLRYNIQALGHDGQATIQTDISGEGFDDFTRRWQLGLRPAYPAITKSFYTVLQTDDIFTLSPALLGNALPDTLRAETTVSPSINLNINNQLNNLLAYPYGCLEQTSSRAWPLVYATAENQARFNLTPINDTKRFEMMQAGIDRIISFQRRNGSFGLWGKDSPEEHWLTVYATDFLLTAQKIGMDVPQAPLQKAVDRLNHYLHSSRTFVRQRWSNAPKHYAFATKAYAAYVLSELNSAPLGTLRNLYNKEFNHANSGLSQIHLGLALLNMGDKQNGTLALEKATTHFDNDYGYWGDYGSSIRDSGMSIHLLLKHNQHTTAAFELAIELQHAVRERQWLSTQERISLFMAGLTLENNANTPWNATWQLGNAPAETLQRTLSWSQKLSANALQQAASLTSKHGDPLYVSTTINGYGAQAPAPESSGFEIERTWFNSRGEPIVPKDVNAGDLLLGHIAVTAEKRIPDALIINLLPAGFELENQNLNHAMNLQAFTIDGELLTELEKNTQLNYSEYRDDRFVAAVNQPSHRASHVFFMMRAVTPGQYRVPPAMVEDMYRPEIRGISDTLDTITILAAPVATAP